MKGPFSKPPMPPRNPCLTCGACCAYYRVTFYWTETDDTPGGTVPAALTGDLPPFRRYMRGTEGKPPRCAALMGDVGKAVRCSIYSIRSMTCREFPVAWENGEPNEKCDKARAAWGLPPLEPKRPRRRTRPLRRAV